MGLFGKPIELAIEKATSEVLVVGSEDIEASLQVCDAIQSKQISTQEAIGLFKKRLLHKNPNVHLLTFQLLDFCAKNGGDHFLIGLASPSFVQFLSEYIRSPQCHVQVKEKALECVQTWGLAFAGKPELKSMTRLYESLQTEGYRFPPKPLISAEFFETKAPPDWGDSDVCMRCRSPFTLTTRKHHCRNCGETFCQSCSSKTKVLPHIGMIQPVRICDGCDNRLQTARASPARALMSNDDSSSETKSSAKNTDPSDIDLAIKLSLEANRQKDTLNKSVSAPQDEDDLFMAAAMAASLDEASSSQSNQHSQSHRKESTVFSSPKNVTESECLGVTPSQYLSETEKNKICRFAETIQRIKRSKEPIRPDVIDMHREIYTFQAKIQRELDEVLCQYHKYYGLQQDSSVAIKDYDAALEATIGHDKGAETLSQRPGRSISQMPPCTHSDGSIQEPYRAPLQYAPPKHFNSSNIDSTYSTCQASQMSSLQRMQIFSPRQMVYPPPDSMPMLHLSSPPGAQPPLPRTLLVHTNNQSHQETIQPHHCLPSLSIKKDTTHSDPVSDQTIGSRRPHVPSQPVPHQYTHYHLSQTVQEAQPPAEAHKKEEEPLIEF